MTERQRKTFEEGLELDFAYAVPVTPGSASACPAERDGSRVMR